MSTFRVKGELSLDGSKFAGGLRQAETAAGRFASGVTNSIGNRLAGLFTIGALGEFARETIELAGRLTDLAGRTGVSVESLQRLNAAAEENGTTLETLIGFWERLNLARSAALRNPEGMQAQAFSRLGVNATSLAADSAEKITQQIAIAFQNSTNVEQFIAPLREIGGRGAMSLAELFRSGLDQMYQDLTVMSGETAEELDSLADQWKTLRIEMMAGFAPALTKLVQSFREATAGTTALIEGLILAYDELRKRGFSAAKAAINPGFAIGEAAKAVIAGLEPAAEAFVKGFKDSIVIDSKQFAKEETERREKVNRRLKFGSVDWADVAGATPDAAKRAVGSRIQSDALLAVGNFLGAAQSAMTRIAERSLTVQQSMDRRLASIDTKLNSDDSGGFID